MTLQSMVPLIRLWETFIEENEHGDVHQFARWILAERSDSPASRDEMLPTKERSATGDEWNENAQALMLIRRLHLFMQMRTKPVLNKIGFSKSNEYAMLIQIFVLENPNKKEVAEALLLEVTTAVEVANRLVKKGLIKEFTDPKDKRATRLEVTKKGKEKLVESYPGMAKIHIHFLDALSVDERRNLVALLKRIEQSNIGN